MSELLERLTEWRDALAASIARMDSGETDNGIMGQIRAEQHDTLDKAIKELETTRQAAAREQAPTETAHRRFIECGGEIEADPVERLRFYCSLAMAGQDWLDAEPFFDALKPPPSEPVGEVIVEEWAVGDTVQTRWKPMLYDENELPPGTKLYTSAAAAVPDAHELWVAAQLMPGEGIEDGVRRIEALQGLHEPEEAD